jgi:acyl-CoA synthetase (AMP-forming)/AMP-acid ligase II/acyl carrier protein
MKQSPGLTAKDTLLAVTTISFDIAVLELYLPLTVGAKIVLVSREVAVDGIKLLSLLKEANANVMQATPATWRLLLASGWNEHSDIKILCGGETLSQGLANELLDKGSSLWNMYGPTEATVWATTYQVTSHFLDKSQKAAVLIGKPIDNTQIYILDQYFQPVPIGVRGELYIGGVCLARGYLNRPDLNSEKFIANPFSDNPNSRLYRTGDIAKYLPNGEIEYIGRIDNQVKIRGFRIELGEIETSLAKYPYILEVAVIVREDSPDDKRIVAYIVPHYDAQELTVKNLSDFLGQNLPQYMLPSSFVMLDSFPMTPNGKVDRKALPAPDISSVLIGKEFIAPSNPAEEFLASLWMEVLGMQQLLSIHDNFFELGGHSLLAMQVISRCREEFSVELTLQSLFEKPTIAGLGDRIQTLLWLAESQKTGADSTTNQMEEFEL